MRRRSVHAAFAALAAALLAVTVYHGVALYQAARVNDAIARADERVRLKGAAGAASTDRRSILADGLALERAGDTDAAVKAFTRLLSRDAPDSVAQAALYDLGNLYLKQALAHEGDGASIFMPLVELSKQRYRDLLRINPDRWDARYNLERALRLAPENQSAYAATEHANQERRQILGMPEQVAPDLP